MEQEISNTRLSDYMFKLDLCSRVDRFIYSIFIAGNIFIAASIILISLDNNNAFICLGTSALFFIIMVFGGFRVKRIVSKYNEAYPEEINTRFTELLKK